MKTNNILNEEFLNKVALVGIFLVLILWIYFWLNEHIMGGGDTDHHYLIARWASENPELFFHHWGKPIFTFLLFIPAQFGLKAGILVSGLSHLGSAFIVASLFFKQSRFVAIVVLFLYLSFPLPFKFSLGLTTEPVFAFFVSLLMLAMVKNKMTYILVLCSCLPFIRNEGALFIPLIGMFLVWKNGLIPTLKKSFYLILIPLLILLLGAYFFNDFLWIIHKYPYYGAKFYGSGSVFTFIISWEYIFGVSSMVLFGWGIYVQSFRKVDMSTWFLIMMGSFLLAHSMVWYLGISSSLGLPRYMISIAPLYVFIIGEGFLKLIHQEKSKQLVFAIMLVLSIENLVRIIIFSQKNPEREMFTLEVNSNKKLAESYESVLYFSPIAATLFDVNPFETKGKFRYYLYNDLPYFQENSLLIWDNHFGANEGNLPLDTLLKYANPIYSKTYNFSTLNAKNYQLVFAEVNNSSTTDEQ